MNKNKLKKALILSLIAFTLNKKEVSAKELNDYLHEQLSYYKENPIMIDYDLNEEKLLYQGGYGLNMDIGYTISKLHNELGDFVYVSGIGNTSSDGSGEEVEIVNYASEGEFVPRVIVGVKSENEYPYAIASYDEKKQEPTKIIGWFKDEDVITRAHKNYDVIEAPVCSVVRHINDMNGISVRLVNDIGIKTYYSDKNLPKGYYLSSNGYYVKEDSLTLKRQKLTDEQMKGLSKYKIKNN